MNKLQSFFVVSLLTAVLVGGQAFEANAAAKPKCNWTGVWTTPWGKMTLIQNGDKVKGKYDTNKGRINGRIDGANFVGQWSEWPTYKASDDAGDLKYAISKDCKTFKGNWRFGTTGKWGASNGKNCKALPKGVTFASLTNEQKPVVKPVVTTGTTGTTGATGATGTTNTAPVEQYIDGKPGTGFAGTWESTYDNLIITQVGDKITGTYKNGAGKIVGTVSGNTAKGQWSEAPTFMPPSNAGDFQFVLGPEGKTFGGDWTYDVAEAGHEFSQTGWTGKRIK